MRSPEAKWVACPWWLEVAVASTEVLELGVSSAEQKFSLDNLFEV